MGKGTPSFGKHQSITHIRCRRCGSHSYHVKKSECASCGFPRAKTRKEKWRWKKPTSKSRRRIEPKHMKPKTSRKNNSATKK